MSTTKRIQGNYLIESLVNPAGPAIPPASLNPDLHQVTIKTSFLTVDGDLVVLGDTTVENIDEVAIEDPVVTLNSNIDDDDNETIDSIPTLPEYGEPVAGLAINRGRVPDINGDYNGPFRNEVLMRYNDVNADESGTPTDIGRWEATDDGINYYPLNGSAGFKLEQDTDPHLGGHLIANGYRISTTGTINDPDNTPPGNIGDLVLEAENDLALTATNIKANTPISIKKETTNPTENIGYNTVYAKDVGSGGTGLYVINNETTDELVSRKKAIIFGLIF